MQVELDYRNVAVVTYHAGTLCVWFSDSEQGMQLQVDAEEGVRVLNEFRSHHAKMLAAATAEAGPKCWQCGRGAAE